MTTATLVLIPGLLCDEFVWSEQRRALSAHANVWVADHGSLDSLTDMALAVLRDAPAEQFALAGHSMGGRVALEVLRLAPHRVQRLALLDTGWQPLSAGIHGEDERASRLALLDKARRLGMRDMGRQWARGMVHPDHMDTPVFASIVDMIERKTPEMFAAQIRALLARPDASPQLLAIDCPTLVMCGRQDRWSPLPQHLQMAATIRGARLHIIEECGHMSTLEQPAAVTAALAEWLSGAADTVAGQRPVALLERHILDPSVELRREPMSRFQWVAVAICVALNALDGFDILAITFAGPGIMREWGLGPGALGVVISTGLVGMSIGSLLIAPLADSKGRRPIILLCLILMTLGMLFSATADSVMALAMWRVITGLGIGGMLASINAMVAEYANDARRDFCVGLMTIGYPLGGMLGGMASAWLLGQFDWRSVFIFGGVISTVILGAVWWRLPESIEFLVFKRSPGALNEINTILRRMGRAAIAEMPLRARQERVSVWKAFDHALIVRTALVCVAYFLYMLTCYYALGWIPSIIAALGFSASVGAEVSVWTNLGGIIGGALLGYLARYVGLRPLASGALILTALALTVFGRTEPDLLALKAVAFVLGFFLFSCAVGFYATFVRVFPTHVRATGTGLAIGLGRFGGMLGPVLGGWLMTIGTSRPSVAGIMALGAALAGLAIWLLQGSLLAAPPKTAVG